MPTGTDTPSDKQKGFFIQLVERAAENNISTEYSEDDADSMSKSAMSTAIDNLLDAMDKPITVKQRNLIRKLQKEIGVMTYKESDLKGMMSREASGIIDGLIEEKEWGDYGDDEDDEEDEEDIQL